MVVCQEVMEWNKEESTNKLVKNIDKKEKLNYNNKK